MENYSSQDNSLSKSTLQDSSHLLRSLIYRPVDITVCAVLGVACGLVMWGFDYGYVAIAPFLRAVLPGFTSIIHGIWYFSGVLAILVVRKAGSAIFVNIVGVITQTLLGNQFNASKVLIFAVTQGILSEILFAIFLYKVYNIVLAVLAGGLTGFGYGILLMLIYFQGVSFASPRGIIHMICETISGFVFAGLMSWFLYRALTFTGALSKFESGRVNFSR